MRTAHGGSIALRCIAIHIGRSFERNLSPRERAGSKLELDSRFSRGSQAGYSSAQ